MPHRSKENASKASTRAEAGSGAAILGHRPSASGSKGPAPGSETLAPAPAAHSFALGAASRAAAAGRFATIWR
jgi:hypothetical protein